MRRRLQRDFDTTSPTTTASSTGASEAMETIARALEPLASDVRLRVIRAVAILLDVDLTGKAPPPPAAPPEPASDEGA